MADKTAAPSPARDQSVREWENVNKVRQLFTQAKSFRSKRMDYWRRAYKIVHNRTWSPLRETWQASPTASEIYPIIASMVGWMTDQRPMIYFNPSVDPGSPVFDMSSTLAHDLEQITELNWMLRDTQGEIEKMLWDALIYGTGFLKTLWDQSLEDGLGDGRIIRIDPFRFYPDPKAHNFDDANYFIEAADMSLQELDRRYPGSAELVGGVEESGALDGRDELMGFGGRPPMANPGGIGGNAPRYGAPTADSRAGAATYDRGVTVYECWMRENDLYFDDKLGDSGEWVADDSWRLVVVAGNRVLMDEPAEELFGHGRHPYTRYLMSDIGEFWGISLVDHLAPLQLSLNRLLAAMQSNAELTGNPVLLEDSRAKISRTKLVNKPGQRVSKATNSDVHWMEPPQMPMQMVELLRFYQQEMERVSGLSAIARGYAPGGRQAQQTLDSIQEASFVRVRMALRNLERALRESGTMLASLICENYTEPRVMSVVGKQDALPIVLRTRHFYIPDDTGKEMPLKFSLWIQAGSSLPTSRQARAQEADMLFVVGGIDRPALLDAHDYPNRQTINDRISQAEQAGTFNPPGKRVRQR